MPRPSSSTSIILLVLALLVVAPAVQAAETYTITAGAGDGGSISPSGAISVEKGSSQAFIIEAFYGFRIQNVLVDQKSLGSIPMYTFTDVNHNHEITAIFEPIYGSLKVSSLPSGAIVYIDNTYYGTTSPDGPVTFSGIIPGIHSVRFVLQGYQEYRVDVQIPAGETSVLPQVDLIPIATTVPTTTPTTSPTTTVPTTTLTTSPTTTVPTTTPTTSPTTTVPTTTPTTSPTTSVPTTTPTTTHTTTVPTTTPTTTHTTTVPTTTFTTTLTTVTTTAPATTEPLTTVTSPLPTSLPVQGNPGQPLALPAIPGIFLILAIGGLATIILSRDVLSSERERNVSVRRKLLEFALFAIPVIAMMIVLDWYLVSPAERTWGIFPELVTAVVPLMLYLVLSSIALMMGALISWPFRGMLKAHTVAGVLVIFLALLALIGGDPSKRFMAGMMLLSGILSTLAARWQDGSYAQGTLQVLNVPAPASISRPGPDDTSVVRTSTGTGLFPQELADKYGGAEFVGSGGLARVFRAKNLQTGQTVALKIPLQHDENTGKAFLKEIMGWEGLSHENIVKVSAVNILPVPYVEMEFIGQTLADMGKPLPMGRSVRICRDVALGLQFAHEKGIIHRDIKPQNILVTPEGIPKITDWGMSKVIGLSGMPTITGFSLAYAAPEQLAPQTFGETDQRTDIYQLGCVLYEQVTGVVPFPGSDMAHVSALIISQKPDLPSVRNPSLQPLDSIIMRCLEKRPGERYQNVRELIHDLEEYLSSRQRSDRYNIFED